MHIMWKADDCISEALVWEGHADITQDSLLLYYGRLTPISHNSFDVFWVTTNKLLSIQSA